MSSSSYPVMCGFHRYTTEGQIISLSPSALIMSCSDCHKYQCQMLIMEADDQFRSDQFNQWSSTVSITCMNQSFKKTWGAETRVTENSYSVVTVGLALATVSPTVKQIKTNDAEKQNTKVGRALRQRSQSCETTARAALYIHRGEVMTHALHSNTPCEE